MVLFSQLVHLWITSGAAFLTQSVGLDDETTVKFEIWDTVRLPIHPSTSSPPSPFSLFRFAFEKVLVNVCANSIHFFGKAQAGQERESSILLSRRRVVPCPLSFTSACLRYGAW
jgi:hypothetical protein